MIRHLALAASLLLAVPAGAQVAAPPSMAELDAHLAFVGEVGQVSTDQIGTMKQFVDAQPLLDSLATPAGVRANGAKVRAILAQTREGLGAIGRRLEAIRAPATSFAPIKPATMLADLRDQNSKMIALLVDYEALVRAAERGDFAEHARLAPKVSAGAFVLLDSLKLALRNRQSAIAPNRSAYQGLGVGIHLYHAMAAAGRAWHNAHLARKPAVAAEGFRKGISGMADNLRMIGSDGRANIARELAELDRVTKGADAQEARTLARLRLAIAERGKLFDVGDEIAAWAEKAEGVTAAQLAAETKPALMHQLVPLEIRFQTIATAEAALAAGKSP